MRGIFNPTQAGTTGKAERFAEKMKSRGWFILNDMGDSRSILIKKGK